MEACYNLIIDWICFFFDPRVPHGQLALLTTCTLFMLLIYIEVCSRKVIKAVKKGVQKETAEVAELKNKVRILVKEYGDKNN